LLIKYIKSVLWRVEERLSYIEDAWCLKVKTNGAPYRGAGDSEIPDDELQPGSQFRDVGAVGVGGANNFPLNLTVSPYNGAVEGVCRFSIDGQPIADRANGTARAQRSSACYIMVAFSCRRILLVPFAAGCHVEVLFRRESGVVAIILDKLTSDCLPCSM